MGTEDMSVRLFIQIGIDADKKLGGGTTLDMAKEFQRLLHNQVDLWKRRNAKDLYRQLSGLLAVRPAEYMEAGAIGEGKVYGTMAEYLKGYLNGVLSKQVLEHVLEGSKSVLLDDLESAFNIVLSQEGKVIGVKGGSQITVREYWRLFLDAASRRHETITADKLGACASILEDEFAHYDRPGSGRLSRHVDGWDEHVSRGLKKMASKMRKDLRGLMNIIDIVKIHDRDIEKACSHLMTHATGPEISRRLDAVFPPLYSTKEHMTVREFIQLCQSRLPRDSPPHRQASLLSRFSFLLREEYDYYTRDEPNREDSKSDVTSSGLERYFIIMESVLPRMIRNDPGSVDLGNLAAEIDRLNQRYYAEMTFGGVAAAVDPVSLARADAKYTLEHIMTYDNRREIQAELEKMLRGEIPSTDERMTIKEYVNLCIQKGREKGKLTVEMIQACSWILDSEYSFWLHKERNDDSDDTDKIRDAIGELHGYMSYGIAGLMEDSKVAEFMGYEPEKLLAEWGTKSHERYGIALKTEIRVKTKHQLMKALTKIFARF